MIRINIFADTEQFENTLQAMKVEAQALKLHLALTHPLWLTHTIGKEYTMDGVPGWKIAYYPIFENGKTGEQYPEPRALVEHPMTKGTDFREVPLRYLS